ncbi:hypothetical protein, partial [Vibrio splendidus]|uniref:hypothetical protein n=2 Tax=Vibrio splendidus TaxID=29497 RepID=UPI001A7E16FC
STHIRTGQWFSPWLSLCLSPKTKFMSKIKFKTAMGIQTGFSIRLPKLEVGEHFLHSTDNKHLVLILLLLNEAQPVTLY